MFFLLILIGWLIALSIKKEVHKIKSDEDLMERFIVYEHRRYRKTINKPPCL